MAQILKNMFRLKGIRIEISNFRRDDQAIIANKDSKINMSPKVQFIYTSLMILRNLISYIQLNIGNIAV